MTTFLVSDTHFSHLGVCQFLREDGTKLRPFTTPEEMDEELVKRWNETVSKNDKVYHLGDVSIGKKGLKVLERLNGDKVLIRGNHDTKKLSAYTKYFRDVRGCHVLDKMILTHVPVHPESKGRFLANVHGHTHARRVMKEEEPITEYGVLIEPKRFVDPFYFSVCVEHTDYRPIAWEEVKRRIAEQN